MTNSTSSFACRRALIGAILLMLAACAERPGPETLTPHPISTVGGETITLLAATNRRPDAASPPTLGGARGVLGFERITLQRRIQGRTNGKAGTLSSPDSASAGTFVTVGRDKLDQSMFYRLIGQEPADVDTVLFVHGYNTSYAEAVFRLAQMTESAGDMPVAPILFSWPSMASVGGYVSDHDAATYARDDLVRTLTLLTEARPSGQVAVLGHSMGGWLVMEALRQLRLQGRADVIARLRVGLAAPDIDTDLFQRQVATIGPLRPRLTVLVSRDDRALAASARLARGKPRLGMVDPANPQVQEMARRTDAQIIDITALPASDALRHDRFIEFGACYAAATQRLGPVGSLQNAGAFVLDTTGQVLASPFEGLARIVRRSP